MDYCGLMLKQGHCWRCIVCGQENILVWVTQIDVVFTNIVEELGQQCHVKLKALFEES